MQSMLGQDGRDAEANLELALAEFRALGERFGISFALSELAEQIAKRGDFAGACELYEQAVAVVTEVGATEDVIRMRTRLALLYWLKGDQDASAAAIAEAERSADGVTLAVCAGRAGAGQAELARWAATPRRPAVSSVSRPPSWATTRSRRTSVRNFTTCSATWPTISNRPVPTASRPGRRRPRLDYAPVIAQMLVGFADLALRYDQYEQAARLLAASVGVRGRPDRSQPDAARIEQAARRHLGEARFAEVTQEGTQTSWSQLVEVTLAS